MLEALVAVSLIAVAGCAAVAVQAAWPYRRYARLAKLMFYVPRAKVVATVGCMGPAFLLLLWNIVPLCILAVTMIIWRRIRPRTRKAQSPPGRIEESVQRHTKEFMTEAFCSLVGNVDGKLFPRLLDFTPTEGSPADDTDKVVADALDRPRMEAGGMPSETESTATTGPQRRMPPPE